ncbi:MAG: YlxR family protein [Microbacterium sp.]
MEPVRTCVGCRARAPRASLLRVVSQSGILVIDERAVLPGRGAWLHPTQACMDAALRRRALTRALRVDTTVDTRAIEDHPFGNKG